MTDLDPKRALRRQMRALRAKLAHGSQAAIQVSSWLPQFSAALIAGYHGLGSELDPLPLMLALAGRGAGLALPVSLGPSQALVFRSWAPGDELAPDALSVPAPRPSAVRVRPDIVITPLLAFDRAGRRLGQGGGHYDRTLQQLRAEGPIFALGLAFAGQEIEEVPAEAHDQKLDAILTETGYREFKKP